MSPLGHLIAWPVESAARIKSTCKAVNLRWVYLPTNSRSLCAATPATIDIGAPGAGFRGLSVVSRQWVSEWYRFKEIADIALSLCRSCTESWPEPIHILWGSLGRASGV